MKILMIEGVLRVVVFWCASVLYLNTIFFSVTLLAVWEIFWIYFWTIFLHILEENILRFGTKWSEKINWKYISASSYIYVIVFVYTCLREQILYRFSTGKKWTTIKWFWCMLGWIQKKKIPYIPAVVFFTTFRKYLIKIVLLRKFWNGVWSF